MRAKLGKIRWSAWLWLFIFQPYLYAQTGSMPLDEIVAHMEAARLESKGSVPFLVTREYRMYHGDEQKPTSEVTAQINVVPPHEREYKILESKGNDRGEKVVRKILDHESAAERLSTPPTAIVRDNYDFSYVGEDIVEGVKCHVLEIKPKRKEPGLIDGRAWVDPHSFLIRKIQGQLAKSPSWWVRGVEVVVLFNLMDGIWTQTYSNAVADVKVLGRYTVRAQATSLHKSDEVASKRRNPVRLPHAYRRSLPGSIYPPGVMIPR
ncbi:MAG TPA: hypothetical protein VN577_04785 [Terriglobales bacterium]|nr:hypothetical protein [Terriglobales bacterium]